MGLFPCLSVCTIGEVKWPIMNSQKISPLAKPMPIFISSSIPRPLAAAARTMRQQPQPILMAVGGAGQTRDLHLQARVHHPAQTVYTVKLQHQARDNQLKGTFLLLHGEIQ